MNVASYNAKVGRCQREVREGDGERDGVGSGVILLLTRANALDLSGVLVQYSALAPLTFGRTDRLSGFALSPSGMLTAASALALLAAGLAISTVGFALSASGLMA